MRKGVNRFGDRPYLFNRSGRSRLHLAQEKRRIAKQVGTRGLRTGHFETGHWMATDEWNAETFCLSADRRLRAADVQNKPVILRELIEKFENLPDRCGQ